MPDQAGVKIPDKVKSGGELTVQAETDIDFVNIYESPRQRFLESDKDQKSPIWEGDIYAISHPGDFETSKKVNILMRRGPDNKPALYGKYMVIVGLEDAIGTKVQKFIEVYN